MFKHIIIAIRFRLIVAIVLGAVSGAMNVALLAMINSVVAGTLKSPVVTLFAGLCVLGPLLKMVSESIPTWTEQEILRVLRNTLGRRLLDLPLSRLESLGNSRLLTALTDDIPLVTGAVTRLPFLSLNIAIVCGCLVYIGVLSHASLAVVVGLLTIGCGSHGLAILAARGWLASARESRDRLHSNFEAMLKGAKELKLNAGRRERFVREVLASSTMRYRTNMVKAFVTFEISASWEQFLMVAGMGTLILTAKSLDITLAKVTQIVIALVYMLGPLQAIISSIPRLAQARVSLRNVEELDLETARIRDESDRRDILVARRELSAWRELSVINVVYRYGQSGSDRFVLGPVTISFEVGQTVFVIGGNGSGKTTLAKLLTGLYSPDEGRIEVDGERAIHGTDSHYSEMFTAVFADCHVFCELMDLQKCTTDPRVKKYMEDLGIHPEWSAGNNDQWARKMSTGQRKRLALLQAIIEDRSVYVFDEWAAEQDPEFRELFYYKLLPTLKRDGKTVFVISHDDRYFGVGDRLVKLECGQVVSDEIRIAQAMAAGVEPAAPDECAHSRDTQLFR